MIVDPVALACLGAALVLIVLAGILDSMGDED